MARTVAAFLMFQNAVAEEAMELYISLFSGSELRWRWRGRRGRLREKSRLRLGRAPVDLLR